MSNAPIKRHTYDGMVSEKQFIRLFVKHEPELRGFAMNLMPSVQDAEDIVQDACVAMWSRIADLENEEGFRPWAFTFIRFTALNRIRKRNRSPLVFSDHLIETLSAEAEDDFHRASLTHRALRTCLGKLTDIQVHLIRSYYTSSKVTMDDVARELKRPVAGLYKSLERIRHDLRACIERELTDEGCP